jgi:hypothetical protein
MDRVILAFIPVIQHQAQVAQDHEQRLTAAGL